MGTIERESVRLTPTIILAVCGLVLAAAGGALGVHWGLSFVGSMVLAAGCAAWLMVSAVGSLVERRAGAEIRRRGWSRGRMALTVMIAVLGVGTAAGWRAVLVDGHAADGLLFGAGAMTAVFLGAVAMGCGGRTEWARWVVGSLATAMAGLSSNYLTGFSATTTGDGISGGTTTTNWQQVRAWADPGLDAIRKRYGIVTPTVAAAEPDISSYKNNEARWERIRQIDKACEPEDPRARAEILALLRVIARDAAVGTFFSSHVPVDASQIVARRFEAATPLERYVAFAVAQTAGRVGAVEDGIALKPQDLPGAQRYEFLVARGYGLWEWSDFEHAAAAYSAAVQVRADEPRVVVRAAESLLVAAPAATHMKELEAALGWLGSCGATGGDATDRARVLTVKAMTLLALERVPEAVEAGREALAVLGTVPEGSAADRWSAQVTVAEALRAAGQTAEAADAIDTAMRLVEAGAELGSRARSRSEAARAKIWRDRGDLDGAEADITSAIQREEAEARPHGGSLADFYALRAELHYAQTQLQSALVDLDTAMRWGESLAPRDERSVARNYAARAAILHAWGNLFGAEIDITRSIDWGRTRARRDDRELGAYYARRAEIRLANGDMEGAESDILNGIEFEETHSPPHPKTLNGLYASRASIRLSGGNLPGAETDIQACIDWAEAQPTRDYRQLARWYSRRATIRLAGGDLAGAEADIQKSMDWGEAQQSRFVRPWVIMWYAQRAQIREAHGDFANAENDLTECMERWELIQLCSGREPLALIIAMAHISQDRGDLGSAETFLESCAEMSESPIPFDQRILALKSAVEARVFRDRGRPREALESIEKSIACAERRPLLDALDLAVWRGDRATILADLGRTPEAAQEMARCVAWFREHLPANEHTMAHLLRRQARILASASEWEAARAAIDESVRLHERVFGETHVWTLRARKSRADIENVRVPER